MHIGVRLKHPLFFSDFNQFWIIFDSLSQNPEISSFVNIFPVEAKLFQQAQGRTDRRWN